MGSFTTQCGISGLTIYNGDRVRMYPIQFRNFKSFLVYPGDMCEILFTPFLGNMNDYGSIDDDFDGDDVATQITSSYYAKNPDRFVSDDDYRSNHVDEDKTLEFIKNVSDGKLMLTVGNKKQPIAWMPVLEDMYQALLKTAFSGIGGVNAFRNRTQKHLQDWFLKRKKSVPYGWNFLEDADYNNTIMTLAHEKVLNVYSFTIYAKAIGQKIESGEWDENNPEWISLRDALTDVVLFSYALDIHEKTVTPMKSSGQGYYGNREEKFLRESLKYIKYQRKERKEQGYED